VVELGTPITLKRYTSNRNGSFVGWRYTPDQGSFNNIPQESPVSNLFLCGQWIAPGGGVAAVMMGGNAVAELVNGYLGNGKEPPAPA
jgi:prolycopene isomerase